MSNGFGPIGTVTTDFNEDGRTAEVFVGDCWTSSDAWTRLAIGDGPLVHLDDAATKDLIVLLLRRLGLPAGAVDAAREHIEQMTKQRDPAVSF